MEYNKLVELLSCPICQEIALSPIYQCCEGHLLCMHCITRLKNNLCPTCRRTLPKKKIRNLVLEQLQDIIEIKCKHWDVGCHKSLQVKDITTHLYGSDCQYEPANYCQQFGSVCGALVPFVDMVDHLLSAHNDVESFEGTTFYFTQSTSLKDLEGNETCMNLEPCYIIVGRQLRYVLLFKYLTSQNILQWTVLSLMQKEKASDIANMVWITIRPKLEGVSDIQYKWSGRCLEFKNFKANDDNLPFGKWDARVTCSQSLGSFLSYSGMKELDRNQQITWDLSIEEIPHELVAKLRISKMVETAEKS